MKYPFDTQEITYLTSPDKFQELEQLYFAVRSKEGRIYSDEVVLRLPDISAENPFHQEWQRRKQSLKSLLDYFRRSPVARTILDLGCGNGWMSRYLATLPGAQVYAVDIHRHELKQAARLFRQVPNLKFIYGDVMEDLFPSNSFHFIVLASAIQYFADVNRLLDRLLNYLKPDGEIHIIDSPIYTNSRVTAARERSRRYYEELGFASMGDFYFHHTYAELAAFPFEVLYNPHSMKNRIRARLAPETTPVFPWIRIPKNKQLQKPHNKDVK